MTITGLILLPLMYWVVFVVGICAWEKICERF